MEIRIKAVLAFLVITDYFFSPSDLIDLITTRKENIIKSMQSHTKIIIHRFWFTFTLVSFAIYTIFADLKTCLQGKYIETERKKKEIIDVHRALHLTN